MAFVSSLVAGAMAGTCVDLVFFPIDTLKTRLQAKNGFFANGGWRGVYSGVGSTIVASAPGASIFFVCYDQGKSFLANKVSDPVAHMLSACAGETAACSIRVPSEVIKQRVQTGQHGRSSQALMAILRRQHGHGILKGLYRGYFTTLMREIPFTAIQFPLYEKLKKMLGAKNKPYVGALCGSVAGGVAAALTTPLDVLKTRLMLDRKGANVVGVFREVAREGLPTFFRGVVPRTLWISAGGSVFLGIYELVKMSFDSNEQKKALT